VDAFLLTVTAEDPRVEASLQTADQLERSQALPTDRIAALREGIQSAESSNLKGSELAKLKSLAPSLEKSAATTKSAANSTRLQALAEILKQPAR
jgi:hypothetical protein